MAYGLLSYNKDDTRESLLSILRDVSPNVDNYFVTNLGKAPTATNTLHEWGVYNTSRPTSLTTVDEGVDPTYADLDTPERSNNYTMILSEPVRVSGTASAQSTITGEDPLMFQKTEALKRLKAKMEYATINGSLVTGVSGTARQMASIDSMISTNITYRNSGTSFTETELNDIIQQSWDEVSSEYVGDVFLCPMVIKRRISGFDDKNTRWISAEESRVNAEIRVYDSEVGQSVKILPHKDVRKVNSSTGTNSQLATYLIREELYKYSFLVGREPMWQDLAQTGDAIKGQYLTEFTMVSFAQRASVKRTGYNESL